MKVFLGIVRFEHILYDSLISAAQLPNYNSRVVQYKYLISINYKSLYYDYTLVK